MKTDKDHRLVPYRSKEREYGVVVIQPGGRVRVGVFKHEGKAKNLIKKCAKRRTIAYSDYGSSWNDLNLHYDLRRVNHTFEYANASANTNVAESFWSLVRKAEATHHHISGSPSPQLPGRRSLAARKPGSSATSGKYVKLLAVLMKPIPSPPKFNRNVKRKMRKEGREAEYFALREVAAAEARALAFA